MIFDPHLVQELFFLSAEISQNTYSSNFECDLGGFKKRSLVLCINGMPTSPQKYFQILGNSQKVECIFFR